MGVVIGALSAFGIQRVRCASVRAKSLVVCLRINATDAWGAMQASSRPLEISRFAAMPQRRGLRLGPVQAVRRGRVAFGPSGEFG